MRGACYRALEQVGFRAMVMKQAIEYNLAGLARNDANEVVHFTLQGDKDEMSDSPLFIIAMPPRSITVFTIKRESCWPLSSCAGRSRGVTHNAMARACAPSIAR